MKKNELPPIPTYLKKLADSCTGIILRKCRTFENAIWLAFLRGKQAGEEGMEENMKKKKLNTRLCLLCRKYISKKNWKRHLRICEPKFKKEKGINWLYNRGINNLTYFPRGKGQITTNHKR